MFWRMLKKSFTKGINSKLLAIITVAFGASLAGAMLTVSLDIGDKVNKELKTYGANLLVEPQSDSIPVEINGVNYNPLGKNDFIKEETLQKLKMIFWAHNIIGFAPYLEMPGKVADREIVLVGTWFNKHLQVETGETVDTGVRQIKPWWEVQGQWVNDEERDKVMIGTKLADDLGIKPGDKVRVALNTPFGSRQLELAVAGVIAGGREEDERIFAPLKLVQELRGLAGKVAKVEVSALTTPENDLARKADKNKDALTSEEFERWYCTAYVSAIAYQIEEAISGVVAKPIRQVASSEGLILGKIQLLMVLLTIAALISSALGISSLMTTKVLERSKEIGLMKAVGAEDWQVILLFLTETAIVGILGGAVGYGLGLGFAHVIGQQVFGTSLSFKPLVIPLVLFLSVGIAVAGSFSAMRIIVKLRPAEVLHGSR